MKTIKLTLLLATIALTQPSWYPPEKYQAPLHFSISAAFCVGTYYLWEYISPAKNEKHRLNKIWWSIPIALIPGISKEFADKDKNKYFNREDMYYNILGAWTAGSVLWVFTF